jgi:hypothetical protein
MLESQEGNNRLAPGPTLYTLDGRAQQINGRITYYIIIIVEYYLKTVNSLLDLPVPVDTTDQKPVG